MTTTAKGSNSKWKYFNSRERTAVVFITVGCLALMIIRVWTFRPPTTDYPPFNARDPLDVAVALLLFLLPVVLVWLSISTTAAEASGRIPRDEVAEEQIGLGLTQRARVTSFGVPFARQLGFLLLITFMVNVIAVTRGWSRAVAVAVGVWYLLTFVIVFLGVPRFIAKRP